MSVIKPFCVEKLTLIGWTWLSSGWAYALPGTPMAAPLPSREIHRLGSKNVFQLSDFLI
jgi:hypothetical protein